MPFTSACRTGRFRRAVHVVLGALAAASLAAGAGCKRDPPDTRGAGAAAAGSSSATATPPPDLAPVTIRVSTLAQGVEPRIGAAATLTEGQLYVWGGGATDEEANPGVPAPGEPRPDAGVGLPTEGPDAPRPSEPDAGEVPFESDLLAIDPRTGTARRLTLVGARPREVRFPAMAHDAETRRLYVFSGWPAIAPRPVPGMFHVDLGSDPPRVVPMRAAIAGPIGRACTAIATDPVGRAFFVFGGNAGAGPVGPFALQDHWRYDFERQLFERVAAAGPLPLPRWGAASAVDAKERQLYVFGGAGEGMPALDPQLYALSLDELKWRVVEGEGTAPPALQGATMTFDAELRALVIAGGLRGQLPGAATSSEVFVFDVDMLRWSHADGGDVLRRRDHVAAYDPASRSHVLFGGRVSQKHGDFFAPGDPVTSAVRVELTREAATDQRPP